MRIAYGKLGRSIPLSSGGASNVGGDIEVIRLLEILLRDHEVHLVTRNRSDLKHPNLVNHWDASDRNSTFYDAINASRGMQRFPDDPKFIEYSHLIKTKALELPEFDEWFIWLGQHGSTLSYLPRVQMSRKELDPRLKGVTRPLISDVNYGFPIISILNTLKVQPRWLCPDPRNRVKFRDLNEPKQHDILSQFDTKKANTFYSPEHGLRRGTTSYKYSGIELLAVPPPVNGMTSECPWVGEEPYRHRFGLLVNEGYHNLGRKNRLEFVKEWVPVSRTPVSEMEIFGHWSPSSKAELGMDIEPVALKYVDDVLQRWRSTMTFPATASGWATAKPWECFKNGCICFKHPEYDSQNHIYSREHMDPLLRQFLSPNTQTEFRERVAALEDTKTWERFAALQWDYLRSSYQRLDYGASAVKGIIQGLAQ